MTAFSAILLAAGESRRMGSINKLALPIGDTPLLRRSSEVLLQAGLEEIIVVVGYQEQVARDLLDELPVTIVTNKDFHQGQMTSVHCGMSALKRLCDAVFVCLSDLPLLEPADLRQMMQAFDDCDNSVLVPTYQGQRGNPIILAHRHRQAILDGDRNLGCKRLIEKNPELVTAYEMDNDHVVFDLDTPQAYQQLQHRLDLTPGSTPMLEFATEHIYG
jgi:molybdenum cofactor cytidylyltransferase